MKKSFFTLNNFSKAARSKGPGGSCVHIARRAGWVAVRDTKNNFGTANDPWLFFTDQQFDAYLSGVRTGNTEGLALNVTLRSDGMYIFRNIEPQAGDSPETELVFYQNEIDAFYDGVCKHEFDLKVAASVS